MSVAERVRRLSEDGDLDLPLPGSGRTWERVTRLAAITRDDTVVGRLAEAHTDGVAILAELDGPASKPGQVWGVWAAEPPQPVLRAVPDGDGYRLDGRKAWCSGASICDHALVTALLGEQRALFAVDVTDPTAHPVPDTWHAVGMAESDSGDVEFDSTPAVVVGAPGEYLTRPGFWHGAVGVAACWYGGACGVADPLLRKVRGGKADPHAAAHLGAVATALLAARESLRHAAVRDRRRPAGSRWPVADPGAQRPRRRRAQRDRGARPGRPRARRRPAVCRRGTCPSRRRPDRVPAAESRRARPRRPRVRHRASRG